VKLRAHLVAGAATLALGGFLAGCSSEPGPPADTFAGDQARSSSVDVDTAALRRHKQQAGIEPCPVTEPPSAPGGSGGSGGPGGPGGSDPTSDPTSDLTSDLTLPDVTLPCLGGGRPVHLAGLSGEPMVLNLWASWCTPCREELPVLQEFHQRAGDKVAMLGVDFEDTRPDAALQLLARSGVTYPQVADFDKEIDQGLGRHPVPMTVLVDADGNVVSALPMQVTSADQLASLVQQSLGVRV
jgi:cytochrome c biogenesis protein CcmG, thiol:disulfide interchange protein DsbE